MVEREVLARHTNTEGEKATIERLPPDTVAKLALSSDRLLILHDEPPHRGGSGKTAPMLLDEGTQRWLADQTTPLLPPEYIMEYWIAAAGETSKCRRVTITLAPAGSDCNCDEDCHCPHCL